ncbi:heme ABC transporter substrate-binding protein IsdE [Paenibacillus polymyxa]|uniref:High-affinity heme uptake system protein IsdE n=1 Tax=Paenibacillus polymyxa TaxID=1406 RepID=A0A378Y3K0_PAEPO|nr:heme ABC transporter substrate-binding protein IsdE [Paenibacillus polymyxa]MBE7900344.1 heme ABC transporter substrate-binding protein IsdE [Paenibacillus polymyxa]MBG9764766.1 heme ABC transporter substrate-binding protein [Paenibacillus polymyxa]MCC3260094.1 heme ABC transporter substrate-binding protein IsdE [Paenibacillus polymyxa]QPK53460.1 heme ABC transporter substrate-binding protein IsdE [Paenibacillus polymyxa]QPK58540.1 heme ABC transporter substrate-binding protein IsdE [Paenib
MKQYAALAQRKAFVFYVLIGIMILLLAGCSGGAQAGQNHSDGSTSTAASDATGKSSDDKTATPRIVATTVAISEITDALGLDLAGKPTSTKVLPDRYKDVPDVGNPMSPDMEKVMSLKPTDVLSVTTLKYDLEPKFKDLNINAEFLNFESLANIQKEIKKLGDRFDKAEKAKEINGALDAKVTEIQQKIKGKKSPKVLILLGVPGSYLVATEHSYIGDLVKIAGGTNVVQSEKVEFIAHNTEALQQSNPDIILRAAHGMPDEVVKMFDEEFKTNDIWKHFNAVKKGHVYDLPEPLFGTTGNLAASSALDELMKMLYPSN